MMQKKFLHVLILYIIVNLGVLLTIYGSILYSPALAPTNNDLQADELRMELINNTKGAFIAQDFNIPRYNIGFDLLNIGGIFLLVGMLFYNYLESSALSKRKEDPEKYLYRLHGKGILKGNILEWLCLILFLFAYFTFFNSIFFYVIMLSFTIGLVGFALRKLQLRNLVKQIV